MKQVLNFAAGVCCGLLVLSALFSITQAAPINSSYLPIAQGGVPAQTAQIYEGQIGWAAGWVDPQSGRVLVTLLSHDQGGKLIVGWDNGVTFTPLPDALPFFPGEPLPGPAFETPSLKDAPGMAVRAFGKYVLYAPMRTEEDGRYNLWRIVW
jgi:hypothetical protein